MRCARDSDWCDGKVCRDRGIECPNADPADGFELEPDSQVMLLLFELHRRIGTAGMIALAAFQVAWIVQLVVLGILIF